MMYCPKCGAKNPEQSDYCIQCAEPLKMALHSDIAPQVISSHLVPAILCTIFCCVPFGIVAIVYAAQVDSKLTANDYAGAKYCSEKASFWCWLSFGLGLAATLIWMVLFAIGAVSGSCGRM
ncbi:MAG: CD225/dispanin family protein [Phycisphaerae bacterium]